MESSKIMAMCGRLLKSIIYTFYVDDPASVLGDFAPFSFPSGGYPDLWTGTGYSLSAQFPEADANRDGIDNALAYGFGLPPMGLMTSTERARFPQTVDSRTGGNAAMGFSIPTSPPDDVVYRIEVLDDLAGDAWQEIASKSGNEAWTGPEAGNISEDSPVDGYVATTVEFPASYNSAPVGFMRVAVEIEEGD